MVTTRRPPALSFITCTAAECAASSGLYGTSCRARGRAPSMAATPSATVAASDGNPRKLPEQRRVSQRRPRYQTPGTTAAAPSRRGRPAASSSGGASQEKAPGWSAGRSRSAAATARRPACPPAPGRRRQAGRAVARPRPRSGRCAEAARPASGSSGRGCSAAASPSAGYARSHRRVPVPAQCGRCRRRSTQRSRPARRGLHPRPRSRSFPHRTSGGRVGQGPVFHLRRGSG
ncbi:MAG: hypothetical protein K0R87_752 [Pseudonocardia sp.]|nr:hypothetical protein [Pseudonocardia sp.]